MPNIKSESLVWLDNLSALEVEKVKNPSAKNAKLADTLRIHKSMVTFLSDIKMCFDPAAIDKVRLAAKGNPPFILSFNSAQALTGLMNKVEDLPRAVHAALDITLSRRLTPKHILALVEWIIAGKSAVEFDHTQVKNKKKIKERQAPSPEKEIPSGDQSDAKPKDGLYQKKADSASGFKNSAAFVENSSMSGDTGSSLRTGSTQSSASAGGLSAGETLIWDTLLGISLISKIKSKVKKGERPTWGEAWLVAGYDLCRGLGKLIKHVIQLFHEIWKFAWKILKKADKLVEKFFGKTASNLVHLVLAIALAWCVWDGCQNGLLHPIRLVGSRILPRRWFLKPMETVDQPTSPNVIGDSPAAKPTIKKQTQSSAGISLPSIKDWDGLGAQESKPYLEQELAGIPPNSIIKVVYFQPDFAMGSDMAYHRLMDLQVPEKYTVRWGADQEKVKAIYSGASNITLTVQNGLGALLGGSSKVNIYWEDLSAIHCSEIKVGAPHSGTSPSKTVYQIALVLAEAKKPLTIQCATTADLGHLVSALEYYIKLLRGGTAPIGGLPYLNQGMEMNNSGVVTTLWAGSPMDKAGITLGDNLWSAEKDMKGQQHKAELETWLQSLTRGTHHLYMVKPAERQRALKAGVPADPIRTKVKLTVP